MNTPTRTSPVRRPELMARFQALADESRLRILELLQRSGEQPAQTIISELGLSQASASRYLVQLARAGFIQERRGSGASKLYRLVPGHIEATCQALGMLLRGEVEEPTPAPQPNVPEPIRRYVNLDGHIVHWPAKQQERMPLLAYLAEQFEAGRRYSEPEVNEILAPHIGSDVASLRRDLRDFGFLSRERDGSSYWRSSPPAPLH